MPTSIESTLLPTLPDPDATVVHVHTRGQGSLGTLSRRELDRRIDEGRVKVDDVFWFPGMEGWEEVGLHPELFADLSLGLPHPSPLSDVMEALPTVDEPDPVVATDSPALTPAPPSTNVEAARSAEPLPSSGATGARLPTGNGLGLDEPSIEEVLGPLPFAHGMPSDEDVRLEAIFADLIQASRAYRDANEFASSIDEVFLGAVITAALDAGRFLSELSSDGTHHVLRFRSRSDSSEVFIRLTHLTGNLTTSQVQGHVASVTVAYGEQPTDFSETWSRLHPHFKGGLVPRDTPGALVLEGDLTTRYIWAQVRLFLRIDDYVERDWSIDYERLCDHLASCVRALRMYLHSRLG